MTNDLTQVHTDYVKAMAGRIALNAKYGPTRVDIVLDHIPALIKEIKTLRTELERTK